MSTSTTALIGVCLAVLVIATPAWADPATTLSGSARPAATASAIARPATPAPALDLSTFGFARAPRPAASNRAVIARPSPAPRVEGSFCEDGRCSDGAGQTPRMIETRVVRRTKPAFERVARNAAPAAPAAPEATARTTRSSRTTKVIRIVQRSPRVITTGSPCVTTCDPCASRVDVCPDPCGACDPCRPACEPRDPMSTPTVFWSSGYHDGRRDCAPCDPCATTVCEPVCAPRRVRVVRCASPCSPCITPRRVCAPVVPRLRARAPRRLRVPVRGP